MQPQRGQITFSGEPAGPWLPGLVNAEALDRRNYELLIRHLTEQIPELLKQCSQRPFPLTLMDQTCNAADVEMVQFLIEQCLMIYASKRHTIIALQTLCKIDPGYTDLVWEKIEAQNPTFFKAYKYKCRLRDQILMHNHLYKCQDYLLQERSSLELAKTLQSSKLSIQLNHSAVLKVQQQLQIQHFMRAQSSAHVFPPANQNQEHGSQSQVFSHQPPNAFPFQQPIGTIGIAPNQVPPIAPVVNPFISHLPNPSSIPFVGQSSEAYIRLNTPVVGDYFFGTRSSSSGASDHSTTGSAQNLASTFEAGLGFRSRPGSAHITPESRSPASSYSRSPDNTTRPPISMMTQNWLQYQQSAEVIQPHGHFLPLGQTPLHISPSQQATSIEPQRMSSDATLIHQDAPSEEHGNAGSRRNSSSSQSSIGSNTNVGGQTTQAPMPMFLPFPQSMGPTATLHEPPKPPVSIELTEVDGDDDYADDRAMNMTNTVDPRNLDNYSGSAFLRQGAQYQGHDNHYEFQMQTQRPSPGYAQSRLPFPQVGLQQGLSTIDGQNQGADVQPKQTNASPSDSRTTAHQSMMPPISQQKPPVSFATNSSNPDFLGFDTHNPTTKTNETAFIQTNMPGNESLAKTLAAPIIFSQFTGSHQKPPMVPKTARIHINTGGVMAPSKDLASFHSAPQNLGQYADNPMSGGLYHGHQMNQGEAQPFSLYDSNDSNRGDIGRRPDETFEDSNFNSDMNLLDPNGSCQMEGSLIPSSQGYHPSTPQGLPFSFAPNRRLGVPGGHSIPGEEKLISHHTSGYSSSGDYGSQKENYSDSLGQQGTKTTNSFETLFPDSLMTSFSESTQDDFIFNEQELGPVSSLGISFMGDEYPGLKSSAFNAAVDADKSANESGSGRVASSSIGSSNGSGSTTVAQSCTSPGSGNAASPFSTKTQPSPPTHSHHIGLPFLSLVHKKLRGSPSIISDQTSPPSSGSTKVSFSIPEDRVVTGTNKVMGIQNVQDQESLDQREEPMNRTATTATNVQDATGDGHHPGENSNGDYPNPFGDFGQA